MDAPIPSDIFLFDRFRLDRRAGGLLRTVDSGDHVPIIIGSRALDVLSVLVERHGELVSKDEIMAAAWPATVVEELNLTVQISTLRRTLDSERSIGSCIQTVPGRGYRFTLTVTRLKTEEQALEPPSAAHVPTPPDITAPPGRHGLARTATAMVVLAGLTVAGGVVAWMEGYRWYHSQLARPLLSIVVLPFANLGSDPEQEYLAEAITDDLTTDLSRISGSVVIAHSTAMSYRDKAVDVQQIGRDLDVRYILEGSVRRIGDQIEVNAQLIDADSATHVWAERFATDRRNLAEAQSQITGRLARTLNLELVGATGRRIEQEKGLDPDAIDLVMRGWDLWLWPFSVATRQEAARMFDRALEIDPRSVEAKIGAATILASSVGIGSSRSPQEDMARAERLLREANENDPQNARAHEVLGMLRRLQNRLDESRIEYETAVELDRNDSHALLGLGQTLMFLGRPADAIAPVERSIRLDPRDPNAAFGDWTLGTCHLLLGHVDQAADLLRKARARDTRVYFFLIYLAGALGLRGDIEEAQATLAEAVRLNPSVTSLATWRGAQPWIDNPAFIAVSSNTLNLGLHRAGMPDY